MTERITLKTDPAIKDPEEVSIEVDELQYLLDEYDNLHSTFDTRTIVRSEKNNFTFMVDDGYDDDDVALVVNGVMVPLMEPSTLQEKIDEAAEPSGTYFRFQDTSVDPPRHPVEVPADGNWTLVERSSESTTHKLLYDPDESHVDGGFSDSDNPDMNYICVDIHNPDAMEVVEY